MPPTRTAGAIDYYEIAARQMRAADPAGGIPRHHDLGLRLDQSQRHFHTPAPTFEARQGRVTRVKWINGLVNGSGSYRRHLLPIDQTLHWANPPGPRDGMGMDPAPYRGPVPLVTHLHGGHTLDDSDGYPEAWYLPAAQRHSRGLRHGRAPCTTASGRRRRRVSAPAWAPGTATSSTQRPARRRRCGTTITRSA